MKRSQCTQQKKRTLPVFTILQLIIGLTCIMFLLIWMQGEHAYRNDPVVNQVCTNCGIPQLTIMGPDLLYVAP